MKATNTCRLCYEEEEDRSKLTSPCDCKGSIEYIHIRCLRLMTKQGKYKHQCPTCKSSWKKIPTPGSTKEHPIDLSHFKLDAGMLDIEPAEGVTTVLTDSGVILLLDPHTGQTIGSGLAFTGPYHGVIQLA
jgi:hypothetical protein